MINLWFKTMLAAVLVCYLPAAQSASTLTDNIRIQSKVLNYALQYRVYLPEGVKRSDKLATIYLADGQWYLGAGNMQQVLDQEISEGRIKPVIAVFVDNRNPDDLSENRRNQQFFYAIIQTDAFEK